MIKDDQDKKLISIDWNLSVKLANNNAELAKELLTMFVMDLPHVRQKILTAYKQNQIEELRSEIHKLHGASCYCGVTKLTQILKKLEATSKSIQAGYLSALIGEFDDEVSQILIDFENIF